MSGALQAQQSATVVSLSTFKSKRVGAVERRVFLPLLAPAGSCLSRFSFPRDRRRDGDRGGVMVQVMWVGVEEEEEWEAKEERPRSGSS